MDCSSVAMLNFQFDPEWDSLQEPFFNEDNENETDQNNRSSGVEGWCKCGKFEPILTEHGWRYCHEATWHCLNGNIRGGFMKLASSKPEIVVANDLQLPDSNNCHKKFHLRCGYFFLDC